MRENVYYRKKAAPVGPLGSVWVAGEEITISREKNLKSPDGDRCDGLFYHQENHIALDANLTPFAEKQTLLHEIWHAIKAKYEIPISHELEEALAGPIGAGMASALAHWLPKGLLKPWEDEW